MKNLGKISAITTIAAAVGGVMYLLLLLISHLHISSTDKCVGDTYINGKSYYIFAEGNDDTNEVLTYQLVSVTSWGRISHHGFAYWEYDSDQSLENHAYHSIIQILAQNKRDQLKLKMINARN